MNQVNPITGMTPITYTYTYVKRVDPTGNGAAEYECFVGTMIPNDPGQNPETTSTLLFTEAGKGNRCSRLADPFKSGMKLVGTKTSNGSNYNIIFFFNFSYTTCLLTCKSVWVLIMDIILDFSKS